MHVFRIASNDYIHDLSGYGAKLNGGRWNREGQAVLYTGSSIALCAWEYWVHLPDQLTLRQNAFASATIRIPDDSVQQLTVNDLPPDWENASDELWQLTDNWIAAKKQLVLQVPSAVIINETNYLINPQHPQFNDVFIHSVAPFQFDKRAFGKALLK